MRFQHKDWESKHSTYLLAKISHFNERAGRPKSLLLKSKPLTWGKAYQKAIKLFSKITKNSESIEETSNSQTN